jgi:alkylated DNA repair dioxygenase AlkB
MRHLDQPSLFPAAGWEVLPLPSASVRLWRGWLADKEAHALYERLSATLQWEQPSLTIAGKTHRIPRLQAWHGDADAVYRYSGTTFTPAPWTPELLYLKQRLEAACDARFNSMLANWYRTGSEGMGFHADKEPELGPEPLIASLSLGGARRFVLKPVPKLEVESLSVCLGNGDLLEMAGTTQRYWRHGIPKTTRAVAARINLTFRFIANKPFNR